MGIFYRTYKDYKKLTKSLNESLWWFFQSWAIFSHPWFFQLHMQCRADNRDLQSRTFEKTRWSNEVWQPCLKGIQGMYIQCIHNAHTSSIYNLHTYNLLAHSMSCCVKILDGMCMIRSKTRLLRSGWKE